MRGGPGLALGIRSLLALVVTPDRAFARSYVEGELNQGKAEPHSIGLLPLHPSSSGSPAVICHQGLC